MPRALRKSLVTVDEGVLFPLWSIVMPKITKEMPQKSKKDSPTSKYLQYLDGQCWHFTHKECPKAGVQKMRVALYRLAKQRDMNVLVRVNEEGVFVQASPK